MIYPAVRNLVNQVCTFGPERAKCGSFRKVFRYPKTFKGLCNNYQEGGGAEKPEGGALPKIAAKMGGGGGQSKITHLTEGGP